MQDPIGRQHRGHLVVLALLHVALAFLRPPLRSCAAAGRTVSKRPFG